MGGYVELNIEAAGFTDIGPTRDENQDAIVLSGLIGLGNESHVEWNGTLFRDAVSCAVIDGMGGYKGGSAAAQLCATFLSEHHIPSSANEANKMLEDLSQKVSVAGEEQGTPRMGAAFAMLTLCDDTVSFINVGDCRIYSIQGSSMGQMSVDDRLDDGSSGITQAIGPTNKPDAHFYTRTLQTGEYRFVLCSDGVWGTLENDLLKQLITKNDSLQDVCSEIREKLYELCPADNCSFVIVEVSVKQQEAMRTRSEVSQ
ncbi:MAG: PP2C family serine/threonine-protein phosphatase [Collinsella sp.]|nr:PP2C family serine/threonine-protein phosphatase [Collinsella sp.]